MATAVLTDEERQQRLNEASAQYMRDEIGAKAYEDAKRQYATDYQSALRALGEALQPKPVGDSQPQPQQPSGISEFGALVFALLLLILGAMHLDKLRDDLDQHRKAA